MKIKIVRPASAPPPSAPPARIRLKAPVSTPAPPAPKKKPTPKPHASNLSAARETEAAKRGIMPHDKTAEVEMYDYTTPGRSALQVACANNDLHYGIIQVSHTVPAPGSGQQQKTRAIVLIGRIHNSDSVEGDLDDALFALAEQVKETYGEGS